MSSQKGDGDSEIALVVEDDDIVQSTMDGQRYEAARFATTLRRKLFREHLGLMSPQMSQGGKEKVTSFMKHAPFPMTMKSVLRMMTLSLTLLRIRP